MTWAVVCDPGFAITNPLWICSLVNPLIKIPTLSPASPYYKDLLKVYIPVTAVLSFAPYP